MMRAWALQVALLGWVLTLSGPAWGRADPSTDPDSLVVALRPLGFGSQGSQDADEAWAGAKEWLAAFASEVEAQSGEASAHGAPVVQVDDTWLLDGHLLRFVAGREFDEALLERANGRRVALVSVTRLVDHYGLELTLYEPGHTRRLDTFSANGAAELDVALTTLAAVLHAELNAPARLANPEPGVAAPEAGGAAASAPEPAGIVTAAAPTTAPPGAPRASSVPSAVSQPGSFQEEAGKTGSPGASGKSEGRAASASSEIVEIRVEGTRRISPDAVRAALRTRVGDSASKADLSEDIRRVYELGFFRDVHVTTDPAPGGQVITFVVDENPIVREVSISGNNNMGSDDITEHLTLTVGSTLDYPLLIENRERIEALYASRGYYLARVSYEIDPIAEGAVAVDFDVDEGEKLRLVAIEFNGNEHFSDRQLRRGMQTRPWSWKSPLTHFWDNSGLYAEPVFYQDLDKVQRQYMDEGFIRIRIGEPDVTHDARGLIVRVDVDEGDQFRTGNVDVIGDESMDTEELTGMIQMRPESVFSRSGLSTDVETLQSFYADRGFYFAKITPRTSVDPETQVVDLAFEVEKGDLYFVDRIDVHGNARTRDGVVRRELSVSEGELYSARALKRSRERVQRLGFFEEVQVEARPTDEPQRVDVDVEVVERPTGSFSFGAGVGSGDGFLLNGALQQANLFGKGYSLTASANMGTENQVAFVRFSNPYAWGSNASYSVTGSMSKVDFDDFKQEIIGFDWTVGYPLDEGDTRGFAGYSFTSREVTDTDVQATSMIQREEVQSKASTSLMSLAFRRDMRDDPRFPTEGYRVGGAMEFAGLGGLNSFLRFETSTSYFYPLKDLLGFESRLVINASAGYVVPLNSISDFDLPPCGFEDPSTPTDTDCGNFVSENFQGLTTIDDDLKLAITERYFVGGLGRFQVRGFKQRSLGPRRTTLTPFGPAFFGDTGVGFAPTGRLPGDPNSCDFADGCNNIGDTDIDDFDNLDLTDVIGGNKFAALNFEFWYPISEELGLQGMLFFDMGNAFSENESINPADFRFGTGGGVRWFSPFGPILLVLGVPLDPLDDEDSSVFEFSFGGSQF